MLLTPSFSALCTLLVAMCVLAQANPIRSRHAGKHHRFAKVGRACRQQSCHHGVIAAAMAATSPVAAAAMAAAMAAAAENNSNKRELQQETLMVMVKTSKSAETSATTTASTSGSSSSAASPPKQTAEKPGKADRRDAFMRLLRHSIQASRNRKRQASQRPQLVNSPYEFMG